MTRLVVLVFALLGFGAEAASAAEAATAIVSPAARFGASDVCRTVAPTFDPRGSTWSAPEAARFQGGARRFDLVAAPCRGQVPAVDV